MAASVCSARAHAASQGHANLEPAEVPGTVIETHNSIDEIQRDRNRQEFPTNLSGFLRPEKN